MYFNAEINITFVKLIYINKHMFNFLNLPFANANI